MSQPCRIFIIENATGKEVEHPYHKPGEYENWEDGGEFLWTDGNYACDCNRGLFFDGEDHPCGDGKFSIRVEDLNGKVIYSEDPTGQVYDRNRGGR